MSKTPTLDVPLKPPCEDGEVLDVRDTSMARIGRVAPIRPGLSRRVKFLWEDGLVTFWRVNYHDWKDENRIPVALFLRVTPEKAEVVG